MKLGKGRLLIPLALLFCLLIAIAAAADVRYYDWSYVGTVSIDGNWQNYSRPSSNSMRFEEYYWENEFAENNPPASFGHMWFAMRFEPEGETMRATDKLITLKMKLRSNQAGHACIIRFDRWSDNMEVGLCHIGDFPTDWQIIDGSQWRVWFEMKIKLSVNGDRYILQTQLKKWHKTTGQLVWLHTVSHWDFDLTIPTNTEFTQGLDADYGLMGGGDWTVTTIMNDVGHAYDIAGMDWKCDIKDIATVSKYFGQVIPTPIDPWFEDERWKCDVNVDFSIDIADISIVAAQWTKWY